MGRQYFRNRSSLRAILQLLAAGSILAISLGVFHFACSSQIKFNADRWKRIQLRSDYSLRYRMHKDLLVMLHGAPPLDRDAIQDMLGDADRSNPDKATHRYELGSRWISLLPAGQYYLRLRFDGKGNVIDASVFAE